VDRPVDPWLFSIVRNQVRDHARRERVRQHQSLDAWLEAGGREPAATDDPAAAAELHELQQRVWRGISELSGTHREIVVLRDYHGLAYADIAGVLSIPTGTVMSRLHAARKRLRDILDESAGPTSPDTSTGRASHE
jgi:RNA polymerase sigma-70 factor (ECF subfamily)